MKHGDSMSDDEIKRKKIRLSPLSRLTMSFDRELDLDKNSAFNKEFYEKCIERQLSVEFKQNQLLRSLLLVNAVIFLVLNGQDWTIPFFEVKLSTIPAIQEILLFYSSLAFFFLCTTFATNQCYIGIINQCGNRIVNNSVVDPDFYNAASMHYEYFLKLYRPELNIWGIDFFQHGKGFDIFSRLITFILLAVIYLMVASHIALIAVASYQTHLSDWNEYAKLFLIGSVILINFTAIAIVFGMNKDFDFYEVETKDKQLPEATKNESSL